MIKRIGVLTSGGDAPGMNAAIRAVVRTALASDLEVYGIYDGFAGILNRKMKQFTHVDVANIIYKGGTILGTIRFPEFKDPEVRAEAAEILKEYGIDALVVIGGDGSYIGAKLLTDELGVNCIALPGTIDNDIAGTDVTIGFATALATIVDAVDKIRDTSSSHYRANVVEVMGRNAGDLALNAAVAVGAEAVLVPEVDVSYDELKELVNADLGKNKKRHAIIIAAEGMFVPEVADARGYTNADDLAKSIERDTKMETRATVLGHIQRGGSPVPADRVLASQLGAKAVELILDGRGGLCLGVEKNEVVAHDIVDAMENKKHVTPKYLYDLAYKIS